MIANSCASSPGALLVQTSLVFVLSLVAQKLVRALGIERMLYPEVRLRMLSAGRARIDGSLILTSACLSGRQGGGFPGRIAQKGRAGALPRRREYPSQLSHAPSSVRPARLGTIPPLSDRRRLPRATALTAASPAGPGFSGLRTSSSHASWCGSTRSALWRAALAFWRERPSQSPPVISLHAIQSRVYPARPTTSRPTGGYPSSASTPPKLSKRHSASL